MYDTVHCHRNGRCNARVAFCWSTWINGAITELKCRKWETFNVKSVQGTQLCIILLRRRPKNGSKAQQRNTENSYTWKGKGCFTVGTQNLLCFRVVWSGMFSLRIRLKSRNKCEGGHWTGPLELLQNAHVLCFCVPQFGTENPHCARHVISANIIVSISSSMSNTENIRFLKLNSKTMFVSKLPWGLAAT